MSNTPNSGPSVLSERLLDKKNTYLYSVLKYNKYHPKLVGTASLQSQYYPADIDMLCSVYDIKPKIFNNIQIEFEEIFKKISRCPNLFFIEFKLQNKDPNEKYKFYKSDDVSSDFFAKNYDVNKIDLCKIDLLQFNNNEFQEISCIYFFNNIIYDKYSAKYIKTLLLDQKQYYNDGNYYKSLKRLMIASKLQEPTNTNLIIGITNFFNSHVGKVYQLNNLIMACLIYIDKYGIDERVRLFINKIGQKGMDPSKLKDLSSDYEKIYNNEALKFYKHFNIPVGKLMVFQKKRF